MTTWWWVRHGPTHAKGMTGWTDLPADLSDHAAVARLAAFLPDAADVISSDLSRAVATASAVQGARHRLPHAAALREIHFGAWEGRTHAEVEAEDPQAIRAFWENAGPTAAPGGESWDGLRTRVDAFVDKKTAAEPRHIIAVAHFGVILSQVQRARRMTPAQVFAHHIDPLSVTQVHFQNGVWQTGAINHRP